MTNLEDLADTLARRDVELGAIDQGIDTTTPGGRSFFTLLAAMAELERDLIVERTYDGLAAARARGRVGGRKPRLSATQVKAARKMYDSREEGWVVNAADPTGASRQRAAGPRDHLHPAEVVQSVVHDIVGARGGRWAQRRAGMTSLEEVRLDVEMFAGADPP